MKKLILAALLVCATATAFGAQSIFTSVLCTNLTTAGYTANPPPYNGVLVSNVVSPGSISVMDTYYPQLYFYELTTPNPPYPYGGGSIAWHNHGFYFSDPVYASSLIYVQTNATLVTNAIHANVADYAKTCTGVSYTNVYRATLTQAGTAAPVATVLENTFGVGNPSYTITWTRAGAGTYKLAMTDLFPLNKTYVIVGNNLLNVNSMTSAHRFTDGAIYVYTTTLSAGNFSAADALLKETPIEVLVYQ